MFLESYLFLSALLVLAYCANCLFATIYLVSENKRSETSSDHLFRITNDLVSWLFYQGPLQLPYLWELFAYAWIFDFTKFVWVGWSYSCGEPQERE